MLARYVPRKLALIPGGILALLAAYGFGFLATNVFLILLFGSVFNFFVYFLNTTLYLYSPELYPTRVRGFGTSLIGTVGTIGSTVMPLLAAAVLSGFGEKGVFTLIAVMYAIFAALFFLVPETFGRSLENVNEDVTTGAPASK